MDFELNQAASSPSVSSKPNRNPNATAAAAAMNNNNNNQEDPMHSWWESVSKARSRIISLSSLLPASSSPTVSSVADSDHPAHSLLSSQASYSALSAALSSPLSGSGSDPLCHWLYDTFQYSQDSDLRLLVLSFIPLLSGLYLSRIVSSDHSDPPPSLAGFEAVLLSLYASETKARAGKPLLITIPDLSQPSLYHYPRNRPLQTSPPPPPPPPPAAAVQSSSSSSSIRLLSAPLEPQIAVRSTKRACIVGVALECYYKHISQLPVWSKLEFCRFAAAWAGQDCSCKSEFDEKEAEIDGSFSEGKDIRIKAEEIDNVVEEIHNFGILDDNTSSMSKGARILLPWELFQPILRILGHCLLASLNSQDVKDAAATALRSLYARASHDLLPQAILATRSLIQLDIRTRAAMRAAAAATASNATTPGKAKKPEILLVSK